MKIGTKKVEPKRKTKRRPRRSMAEIVRQINSASYRRHNAEFACDGPVGREVW